ncbi:hypothetical protein [Falsiroseomonas bella]|nr:hypothetical protein [Falsiroseomonas bella]
MEPAEFRRRLSAALTNAGRSGAERRAHGAMPQRLADVGRVRHDRCQWPMWPTASGDHRRLVCGAVTDDASPYCAAHRRLAEAPPAADPALRELREASQTFRARWADWVAQRQPPPPAITAEIAATALELAKLAGLAVNATEAGP